MKKLTVKQQRYVDCFEGTIRQSAKLAGISYTYARELHTKPLYAHIMKKIKKREDGKRGSKIKSRKQRQEFWSKMMEDAEKDSDKLKSSELLGRSEADFTDKILKKDETLEDIVKEIHKNRGNI